MFGPWSNVVSVRLAGASRAVRSMVAPRRRSQLGYLNIHIDEVDKYRVDLRVQRNLRRVARYARNFETLSAAVDYRDGVRAELGRPPAEDDA